MDVASLRPFAKRVELTVKVLSKNEPREVSSRLDGSSHKVTEAVAGDASGTVLLTLWDDLIEKVEDGKTYKISNAYTSLFQRKLRLNIGRYGTIEESSDEISEVNEENNVSEREVEFKPRRFGNTGFRQEGFRGNRNRENRGFRRGRERKVEESDEDSKDSQEDSFEENNESEGEEE